MKIFIYEHFSCGGAGHDNPLSIEGGAILRSAMRSFARVPGVEPFTIDNYVGQFGDALSRCDGALIVAPETGGLLADLTSRILTSGKQNLGSSLEAISAAGDKLAFSRLMESAGVPHPATIGVTGRFDSAGHFAGAWVLKPSDGAGADGLVINRQPRKVDALMGPHVAQEFVEGEPMSLSVASSGGWVEVLSVNRQRFTGDGTMYDGGEITGDEPDAALREMAVRIKRAIPGLSGYWGVDFVMTQEGPVVIEVNPRLTTSFCGLVEAMDPTPAAFVLAAANGSAPPAIKSRQSIFFTKAGLTRAI